MKKYLGQLFGCVVNSVVVWISNKINSQSVTNSKYVWMLSFVDARIVCDGRLYEW